MATEKDQDYLKRTDRGVDPVADEQDGTEAEGDTNDVLAGGQAAASRNVRATEYSGVKHNTEPYGSTQTAGAEQKDTGHAVGITSKKLSEEVGAAGYVKPGKPKGNEGAFADDVREASTEGDLPKGEAEKIGTVEVSTMTPHK